MAAPSPIINGSMPRAYFYSSNAEVALFRSATPAAQIHFQNNTNPETYTLAANHTFQVIRGASNVLFQADLSTTGDRAGLAEITVGSTQRPGHLVADAFRLPPGHLNPASNHRAIIFEELGDIPGAPYTGIGIRSKTDASNAATLVYQTATTSNIHAFYTGSAEVARLQTGPNGIAQLAIGVGAGVPLASNAALTLPAGTTAVFGGNVSVAGRLDFDRSGLVAIDSNTQRLAPSQLPLGLIYVDSNTQQLDPALIPNAPAFQYLRGAARYVGIGTRAPAARLHVQGSALITDRLGIGIGTQTPAARLHLSESNINGTVLRLDNPGGGPILHTTFAGSNLLFAGGQGGLRPFVGIGTTAPIAPQTEATVCSIAGDLTHGGGTFWTSNLHASRLSIGGGPGDAALLYPASVYNPVIGNPEWTYRSFLPFEFNNGLAASSIRLPDSATVPYVRIAGTGLRCDESLYVLGQVYNLSDARAKTDIAPITDALDRLDAIRGYTYRLAGAAAGQASASAGQATAGLLAHEVAAVLPEAVITDPEPSPNNTPRQMVNYDAIIALLVEAVRGLREEIAELRRGAAA